MTSTSHAYQESASVPPPWEERSRFGFLAAYWLTVRSILTRPAETFARMPRYGNIGAVLLFAVLCQGLSQLFTLVWSVPVTPLLGSVAMAMAVPFLGSVAFVFMPLITVVSIIVAAIVVHSALRLLGAGRGGFEATLRALAYASAPLLITAVPILGIVAGVLWMLALVAIGLTEIHASSTGVVLAAMGLSCVMLGALGLASMVLLSVPMVI